MSGEKFNTEHSFGEISIKEKRVQKFFEVESLKFQKSIEDVSKKIENLFSKLETKFGGMYNHLLKVFLVNLEKRVYANEAATKAVIEVVAAKMYELEKKNGLIDSTVTYQEYKNHFNSSVDFFITDFYEKNKREENDKKDS